MNLNRYIGGEMALVSSNSKDSSSLPSGSRESNYYRKQKSLGVEKRRSMLLTKKTKNYYSWKGFGIIPKTLQLLKADEVSNPTKEQLVDVVQRHFMMMYQNQKLVQQLDVQKHELHNLEGRIRELKDKQSTYDEILITVNQQWNQLVDDFIFLGARVGAGKNTVVQLSKIDNMMKEEANNLHEVIEILHLKHKEYDEDMQGSWFRIDDTEVEYPFPPFDKIGINSVQREVEEIILDIYISERNKLQCVVNCSSKEKGFENSIDQGTNSSMSSSIIRKSGSLCSRIWRSSATPGGLILSNPWSATQLRPKFCGSDVRPGNVIERKGNA
ncbi:hypothetical protein AgCh_020504 [Apium graveolens]